MITEEENDRQTNVEVKAPRLVKKHCNYVKILNFSDVIKER